MSYYIEKETMVLSAEGVELLKTPSYGKNQCLTFAHLHRAIEILLIQNGKFEIETDGERSILNEGDVALLRSETIHQVYSLEDGNTGYLVYKIMPELFLDFAGKNNGILYLLQLNYRKNKYIWRREEIKNNPIQHIIERVFYDYMNKPHAMELSIKANAILLLTELLRSEADKISIEDNISIPTLHKIYSAINIINTRFKNNLTASECALEVDMSYTHFSRCFKSVTGKSFTKYLAEVRVNHAEKDLFLTDKTITEIAYTYGFNDASYFVATYKKLRGTTPHKMRNKKS